MTPLPDDDVSGDQTRFNPLAAAAMMLALLPLIASFFVGMAEIQDRLSPKPVGIFTGLHLGLMFAWLSVLIGGSLCAVLAVVLGAVALRQIRGAPHTFHGRQTALAAIVLGSTSLVLAWGGLATKEVIHKYQRAPFLAAEANILEVYWAACEFAQKNGTFPARLEQVTSREVAAQYVYYGENLPFKFADYQTPGSPSIVIMHTKDDLNGIFVAICANRMTHEWTRDLLDRRLRNSENERAVQGVPR